MKTVEEDGWPAVRLAVFYRDKGCVAVQRAIARPENVATDPCRDRWNVYHPFDSLFRLELDHVSEFPAKSKKAPDDEAHLQAICGHHHEVWAGKSVNRAIARDRLSGLYPDAWARWLAR